MFIKGQPYHQAFFAPVKGRWVGLTDEEKNIFGKQLKERRNELNLTTQKVALDAEVGESTYKRLEEGEVNHRLDKLVRIIKWQIVRKIISMDKKKMDKTIKTILAMLDAMSDD